jgi:hypothetical protein
MFFFLSSSSFILTRAEWTPFQTHCYSENVVAPGIEPGTSPNSFSKLCNAKFIKWNKAPRPLPQGSSSHHPTPLPLPPLLNVLNRRITAPSVDASWQLTPFLCQNVKNFSCLPSHVHFCYTCSSLPYSLVAAHMQQWPRVTLVA